MLLQFTIIIIPTDLEHGAKAEQSPGAGVDGVNILDDIEAGDDQGEPQLDDAEVNHHGPQGDPAQGGEPGPLTAHTHSLTDYKPNLSRNAQSFTLSSRLQW